MTDPIKKLAMSMIARIVIKSVNDSGGIQIIKGSLFADVVKDDLERFQNYGFTGNPPIQGAEGVVIFPGGNPDHGIILAVENRRYRLKDLGEGEVAIYTDEGDKIHLKRNRNIDIVTTDLNIEATNMNVNGNLVLNGNNVATIFNAHTHTETGGNTGTPNATL